MTRMRGEKRQEASAGMTFPAEPILPEGALSFCVLLLPVMVTTMMSRSPHA